MADAPLQVTGPEVKADVRTPVREVLTDVFRTFVAGVQDYSLLCARSVSNIFSRPFYFQDTLTQMDDIGVGSLPIVLLAGLFIGAVLVLQTATQFVRFGQASLTGDAVSIALVRELGPTLTGLLVCLLYTSRCV